MPADKIKDDLYLKEFFENYSKDTTVEDNNDGVKEALAETVDSNNNEENIPSANEQTMDNITQAVEKKIQVAEDNKSSDNLMGQNHSDKTQQSNTTVTDISEPDRRRTGKKSCLFTGCSKEISERYLYFPSG